VPDGAKAVPGYRLAYAVAVVGVLLGLALAATVLRPRRSLPVLGRT